MGLIFAAIIHFSFQYSLIITKAVIEALVQVSAFFSFSSFSHKLPSGLQSACVTSACIQHMEFTEVIVVKSQLRFHDFQGDEITYKQTHHLWYTNTKRCQAILERVSLQGLLEINLLLLVNILSEFIKNHVIPKELSTETKQLETISFYLVEYCTCLSQKHGEKWKNIL